MSLWNLILVAAIAVLALKLAGYLVPPSVLEKPAPARIAGLLTVALLAALVAVNTLTGADQQIVLDARLPALVLAGALFALRVPFIVVLVAAAACAALLRLWAGLG